MKNVLIIYRVDMADLSNLGIQKKLNSQVKALKKAHCKVDHITHHDNFISFNFKPIYAVRSWKLDIYFNWVFYDYIQNIDLSSYDICIIRYGLTTKSLLRFIKKIKDANEHVKIIIDMPTYPYAQEYQGIKGMIAINIDKHLRFNLKKHIDYILHSGQERHIFGIPTLQLTNGVDIHNYKKRKVVIKDHYRMIAIGKWAYWHGLDRMIKGMSMYKGSKRIYLDIIGEGPELLKLKKLSRQLGIQEQIQFYGVCIGDNLNKIVSQGDIGVGTLGLFRKGVKVDSSLKHREYLMRGLPVILASQDADISQDHDFVHCVKESESPIDVNRIVEYLSNLDHYKTALRARQFAKKNLSWDQRMASIIEKIYNN